MHVGAGGGEAGTWLLCIADMMASSSSDMATSPCRARSSCPKLARHASSNALNRCTSCLFTMSRESCRGPRSPPLPAAVAAREGTVGGREGTGGGREEEVAGGERTGVSSPPVGVRDRGAPAVGVRVRDEEGAAVGMRDDGAETVVCMAAGSL